MAGKKGKIRKYIRTSKSQIKYWKVRDLCMIYGVPYPFRKARAWIAKEIYSIISKRYQLESSYEILASKAYLFRDIGMGILEKKYMGLSGDILLTHPLKSLSREENVLLAAAVSMLAGSESMRNNYYLDNLLLGDVQKKAVRAIVAAADLACALEDIEVTGIKETMKKDFLFLVITNGSIDNNICNQLQAPWWQLYYGMNQLRFSKREGDKHQYAPDIDMFDISMPSGSVCFYEKANAFVSERLEEAKRLSADLSKLSDPDIIHDVRVAFRKLISFCTIFEDYLNRDWKKKYFPELKEILKVLGGLRDFDVMEQNIKGFFVAKDYDPQRFVGLQEIFSARHQEKLDAVTEYFSSKRYKEFLFDIQKSLKEDGLCCPVLERGEKVKAYRPKHILADILQKCFSQIMAYREWFGGLYIPEPMLHRLRITFKELRYALDFFREDIGHSEEILIGECKELQDLIGDLHDKVVLIGQMEELLINIEDSTGQEIEMICKLTVNAEMEIDELSEKVMNKWKKFLKKYEKTRL